MTSTLEADEGHASVLPEFTSVLNRPSDGAVIEPSSPRSDFSLLELVFEHREPGRSTSDGDGSVGIAGIDPDSESSADERGVVEVGRVHSAEVGVDGVIAHRPGADRCRDVQLSSNGGVVEEEVRTEIVRAGGRVFVPSLLRSQLHLSYLLGSLDVHCVLSPVSVLGCVHRRGVVALADNVVDIDAVH